MATVEMFDHTADVGLRVTADTLDELFRAAAEGLFDYIVVNRCDVKAVEVEAITLASDSPGELLAVWLNELIFRSETTHRVYGGFEVSVGPAGLTLAAKVSGEPIDRDRHVLDHEVKAVTRHGLELSRSGAGWVAEMILDI